MFVSKNLDVNNLGHLTVGGLDAVALAERYGTYIVDSEIVGLTPAKAMIDCAEFYLKARDFDCHNQIMEYHLIGME